MLVASTSGASMMRFAERRSRSEQLDRPHRLEAQAAALDATPGPTVVVPLLLSTGYHVLTDIPGIVSGRADVRVARHLGPDPRIADMLAERLADARRGTPASTVLVGAGSSRPEAAA